MYMRVYVDLRVRFGEMQSKRTFLHLFFFFFFLRVPRRVCADFLTAYVIKLFHSHLFSLAPPPPPARRRVQVCARHVESGRDETRPRLMVAADDGKAGVGGTVGGGTALSRTHLSGLARPSSLFSAAGLFLVPLRIPYVSSPSLSVRSHCCFFSSTGTPHAHGPILCVCVCV